MPFPTTHYAIARWRLAQRLAAEGPRLRGFRGRLLERRRVQPRLDRGWEWLEANCRDLTTPGARDELERELVAHLEATEREYGFVPLWVFAIFLKVLASILIDLWLTKASEEER